MRHSLSDDQAHKLSVAALFLVATIWGAGFVFSKIALEAGFGPATVMFFRFTLAAALNGVVFRKTIRREYKKGQWKSGLVLGGLLFGAFFVQIVALQYTTPANNAFLTGVYVVLVPLLWWAFSKRRPPAVTFAACVLSFAGVGILSYNPAGLRISGGDALTLLAALLFAAHIVATGAMARSVHHVVLNLMQFCTAAVLSGGAFLLAGQPPAALRSPVGWAAVVYLGVCSIFVCYLLQTWAQKRVPTAQTGVILATEALFGSVFSVLLGFDRLTPRMVVGGLVMFLSIVLPEWWAAARAKRVQGKRIH